MRIVKTIEKNFSTIVAGLIFILMGLIILTNILTAIHWPWEKEPVQQDTPYIELPTEPRPECTKMPDGSLICNR